jgi:hypothetical protein
MKYFRNSQDAENRTHPGNTGRGTFEYTVYVI